MHGGAILIDRHDKYGVRKTEPEGSPGQTLGTRRLSPLTDPNRQHPVGQSQDIAPLQVFLPPAVDPLDSDESRMECEDQFGQLGFAPAGRR